MTMDGHDWCARRLPFLAAYAGGAGVHHLADRVGNFQMSGSCR